MVAPLTGGCGSEVVHEFVDCGAGPMILISQGAVVNTTTPAGKLVFGIFAALAGLEREPIVERTKAGLAAARVRGRHGRRPYEVTAAKLRLAQAAMAEQ